MPKEKEVAGAVALVAVCRGAAISAAADIIPEAMLGGKAPFHTSMLAGKPVLAGKLLLLMAILADKLPFPRPRREQRREPA